MLGTDNGASKGRAPFHAPVTAIDVLFAGERDMQQGMAPVSGVSHSGMESQDPMGKVAWGKCAKR